MSFIYFLPSTIAARVCGIATIDPRRRSCKHRNGTRAIDQHTLNGKPLPLFPSHSAQASPLQTPLLVGWWCWFHHALITHLVIREQEHDVGLGLCARNHHEHK